MQSRPHSYISFDAFDKSFALVSAAPTGDVERAVVFVHGFNGSARDTWTDFLSLVDDEGAGRWWELSDIFFFDYKRASVFSQLINNTLEVYRFIHSVFPQPFDLFKTNNPFRDKDFQYRELFLVGHSEGGLLLRKAVIEAAQRDPAVQIFLQASKFGKVDPPEPTGLLLAKLRLFAPALGGEMLTGIYGVTASLPIISNALSSSAAKQGMSPSSAAVTEARRQTDHYAYSLPFECFRAHIVWAEEDLIISAEKYERDRHGLSFPSGTSHTSVCKPTWNYSLPLDFVESGVL